MKSQGSILSHFYGFPKTHKSYIPLSPVCHYWKPSHTTQPHTKKPGDPIGVSECAVNPPLNYPPKVLTIEEYKVMISRSRFFTPIDSKVSIEALQSSIAKHTKFEKPRLMEFSSLTFSLMSRYTNKSTSAVQIWIYCVDDTFVIITKGN